MARILLCWELGGGLGHLVPLAEAGRDLEKQGHEVAYALRDLAYADALFDVVDARLYQAPLFLPLWRDLGLVPETFADILHTIGYRDASRLVGLIAGWRRIYADFNPDLIVHDHSPTAMLAARGLDIPAIGLARPGFTLPPASSPMPDLRNSSSELRKAQADREKNVTRVINVALERMQLPAIGSIAELFELEARILLSIPEIDPYGPRDDVEYWGPLEHGRGDEPAWPQGQGKRIFAYVKQFDACDALLDILAETGNPVLAHIGGMDADECAARSTASMTLSPTILDIRRVLDECDVVVTHGGSLVASILLAGKPVLTLPLYLEQQITGEKLQALGASLNAPQRLPQGMQQKLRRLLDEPVFTESARAIAERHRSNNLLADGFNGRFAARVERILASRRI